MLETIIHIAIVTFAGLTSLNYSFLFKMITLDSLFGAIHFLFRFLDNNLTKSQIINESNSLYHGTGLDRYIYYTILYLAYKIFYYFFWVNESSLLYYIGLFTLIPAIMNKILQSNFFEIIRKKKELFVKTIIAKSLTSITKYCSRVYLNKEADLHYTEIMEILKDYTETISYFLTVLKSLLVIFGLSYVKNYAPSMYYGIIKYIYNYKTGEMLTSHNYDSAKHFISDIIDNKKWYELTKANTFKAIVCLYQMNPDKVDIFGQIVNDFNFALIKMFSIWTISSLFSNIYIASVLSLFLLFYNRYVRKSTDDLLVGEICIIGLSTIAAYFTQSYLFISFMTQFGPKILFNSFIYIVVGIIIKNIKELISTILMTNKNVSISFVTIIGYILLLKFLNTDSYLIVGLNIIANIFMGIETKKQIIFAIILTSTVRSNYNFNHILFNSLLLYILFGLFNFIFDTYTIQDLLRISFDYLQYQFKSTYIILSDMHFDRKKIAFDILDTKKYPSISQLGQKIERKIELDKSSLADSVSLDDPIFNQPDEVFLSEISVNDDDSSYLVKSRSKTINIIDEFF